MSDEIGGAAFIKLLHLHSLHTGNGRRLHFDAASFGQCDQFTTGCSAWNELGRFVIQGENDISILAPVISHCSIPGLLDLTPFVPSAGFGNKGNPDLSFLEYGRGPSKHG